jgi:hypothetical protein
MDSPDSGCGTESEEPSTPETPEALADLKVPREVRKTAAKIATHAISARQIPRTVRAKPPRLHSIQVGHFNLIIIQILLSGRSQSCFG